MVPRLIFIVALLLMCRVGCMAVGPVLSGLPMPARSEVMPGYNGTDSLCKRLAARPLHPVEGLWHFPADGGRVAIEREESLPGKVYNIVALQTSNHGITPGTLLGRLRATAKPGVFEAQLYMTLDDDATSLSKPAPFTLQLDEERALMTFTPIHKGIKVDLLKLLPYWLRRPLKRVDDTPDNLQGLQRIFPAPEIPAEPVYL